jgi:hypothetical protein
LLQSIDFPLLVEFNTVVTVLGLSRKLNRDDVAERKPTLPPTRGCLMKCVEDLDDAKRTEFEKP